MIEADAGRPPNPDNLGDPLPPEGSARRKEFRERVNALLLKLADDLEGLPLLTPAVIPAGRMVLCADASCDVVFEADGPQACPRCGSMATVRCAPRPLLPKNGEERPLRAALEAAHGAAEGVDPRDYLLQALSVEPQEPVEAAPV